MIRRIVPCLAVLAACSSPTTLRCAADTACPTGNVCVDGVCVTACASDKDCRAGRVCQDGRCTDATGDAALPVDASAVRDASAPIDQAIAVDAAISVDATVSPDLVAPPDLATPPDLVTLPSSASCFMGWTTMGGACPAPVITQAYYANSGCANTAGMFFVGQYFQYNGPDSAGGYDGPTTGGTINYVNVSRWNMLSDTMMCVTICPSCGASGNVYVTNPDGKMSNTVAIQFH